MDPAREQARQILDATRLPETGPVTLDDAYLRLIRHVESLPQNQSGADKTWVWESIEAFEQHYRHAVRVR